MRRYLALDSIRGICAVLVAVFHFPADAGLVSLAANAYLFVDFFFVLSGFVIMHAYGMRLDRVSFLVRRVGRIWPLHITMLLVLLVLEIGRYALLERGISVGPPVFEEEREPFALVTNSLLVHCWGMHSEDTWNGPSWSISVEMFAYIAFAFLSRARIRSLLFGILVLGSWVIVWLAPEGMQSTYDYGIFRGILGFFLGCLVYDHASRGEKREKYTPHGGTLREVAAVALVITSLAVDAVAITAPAIFAFAVYVFADENGRISRWLLRPTPRRLGEWSYSIYMVHAPLIVCALGGALVVEKVLGWNVIDGSEFHFGAYGDAAVIAYLALVVAVARVTHKLVEMPGRARFNTWSEQLTRSSDSRES